MPATPTYTQTHPLPHRRRAFRSKSSQQWHNHPITKPPYTAIVAPGFPLQSLTHSSLHSQYKKHSTQTRYLNKITHQLNHTDARQTKITQLQCHILLPHPCSKASACADSSLHPCRELSALADTFLHPCSKLSALADTSLHLGDRVSALADSLLHPCKPFSAKIYTVL